MDTFDALPVAAMVNGIYMAMHGGISERLTSAQAINEIDRGMEPGDDTLLADLLWADPAGDKLAPSLKYMDNDKRGISVVFGRKPLNRLLK